jgi:hypothetical protein
LLACTESKAARDAGPDPICGELRCELFDTPAAALSRVMEDKPRVLAFGETHAQLGASGPSTTARFTSDLLPGLRGKTTDLVLELWVASGQCNRAQKNSVSDVASAQREVTRSQAPTNGSDFIALYTAARNNGMKAHILVPDCDEYAAIADAGAGDIDAMLRMIARLTEAKLTELLDSNEFVVAYGGAMHNDLEPRAGHEKWSFGPAMAKRTGDRYVELDVISADAVGESESWQAQPWYAHFRHGAQGSKALLYTMRPHAYALVLP